MIKINKAVSLTILFTKYIIPNKIPASTIKIVFSARIECLIEIVTNDGIIRTKKLKATIKIAKNL